MAASSGVLPFSSTRFTSEPASSSATMVSVTLSAGALLPDEDGEVERSSVPAHCGCAVVRVGPAIQEGLHRLRSGPPRQPS